MKNEKIETPFYSIGDVFAYPTYFSDPMGFFSPWGWGSEYKMYDLFGKEILVSKVVNSWSFTDRVPDIFAALLHSFTGRIVPQSPFMGGVLSNDLCSYLGGNPEVKNDLIKLKEELLQYPLLQKGHYASTFEEHMVGYELLFPAFENFVMHWDNIREKLNPLGSEIKLEKFVHPDLKDYSIDKKNTSYRMGWLYQKYGNASKFYEKYHMNSFALSSMTHPPEFVSTSVDYIISGFNHFYKYFFDNYEKIPKRYGINRSNFSSSSSSFDTPYPLNISFLFLHELDPKLPLREALAENAKVWIDRRLVQNKYRKWVDKKIKRNSVKVLGKWMDYLEETYGLPLDPQYLLYIAYTYVSGTATNYIFGPPGDNTLYIFNEYDPEIHPALR